jgi:HEPN domain-containing protein
MVDLEYANEWLRFAEMDLSSANHLTTHFPFPSEIICYLCQQSSEKSLKGLLVLNEITPPKIHDLVELHILCEPFVTNLSAILTQCNVLNKFSVIPRYPNEIQIAEDDARGALKYAKDVLDFVRPFFSKGQNDG